ncbi:MAG: virulence factor [Hyphomicrobiaceae bacterium]|nr:virulence factor [Hyphomicrobiaceae bacterium]
MFAIAIDLDTKEADVRHPKKSRRAYLDIETTLGRFGVERVQWSVCAADDENLANLISAIDALRTFEWFRLSVRSIRAFRMEQGSDLTNLVQRGTTNASS